MGDQKGGLNLPTARLSRPEEHKIRAPHVRLGVDGGPVPLQHAVPGQAAVGGGQVGGHGDGEVCVVGRQLGEVAVAVIVKLDEGRAQDGVGGRLDDRDVGGPAVQDGELDLHRDNLARAEDGEVVEVVEELVAAAEAEGACVESQQSLRIKSGDNNNTDTLL